MQWTCQYTLKARKIYLGVIFRVIKAYKKQYFTNGQVEDTEELKDMDKFTL